MDISNMSLKRLIVFSALLLFLISFLSSLGVAESAVHSATDDTLLYGIMISDSQNQLSGSDIGDAFDRLDKAANYFEERAPSKANLDIDVHYDEVNIDYVGNYWEDKSFVPRVVEELGYTLYSGDEEDLNQVVEHYKGQGYDNVAIFFIVPQSGPKVEIGGDERDVPAYADVRNDPQYVVQYFYSVGIIGDFFGAKTPAMVYAHELGHLFGAMDEYESDRTEYGDYSFTASQPMSRLYRNFNVKADLEKGGIEPKKSIMGDHRTLSDRWDFWDWFDIDTPLSVWAEGMIGWRDFNMDGTLDAYTDQEDYHIEFEKPRKPLLNSRLSIRREEIPYIYFDDVTLWKRYDQTHLVDSAGAKLKKEGTTIDHEWYSLDSRALKEIELSADVSDSIKPGEWEVELLFGNDNVAATYPITVTAPEVQVLTPSIDFGRFEVGETSTEDLLIENEGDMVLDLSQGYATDFNVLSTHSIGTEEQEEISLSIQPDEPQHLSGEITYETNDPIKEEIKISYSGTVFEPYQLQISGPTTSMVNERNTFEIGYEDRLKEPTEYEIIIKRNGVDVTNQDAYVQKEVGKAEIEFERYGDYTINVDKTDTDLKEYDSDSISVTIQRPTREKNLDLEVDKEEIEKGEEVTFSAFENGEPTEATFIINGEEVHHGHEYTTNFDEKGEYDISIQKDDEGTPQGIIEFEGSQIDIEVKEKSEESQIDIEAEEKSAVARAIDYTTSETGFIGIMIILIIIWVLIFLYTKKGRKLPRIRVLEGISPDSEVSEEEKLKKFQEKAKETSKCPRCGKEFDSEKGMKIHKTKKHKKEGKEDSKEGKTELEKFKEISDSEEAKRSTEEDKKLEKFKELAES